MKIKLNDGSFILEKDNTEIDVFEKLNGGIAILGENIPDNYIVGEDNNAYRVLPDNNIVPVSHPDLSTQPSILPYRFGSMPINEVLIANGREDEIPSDAMVIEAFSFNKDICVPAIVEKNYKEEHKYTIDINFELPKSYRDFTENDAITFSDVPTIEDIENFLIFYQNDSSFITTKEYEGQSEIYFSIKNTMGGTPFASFLWIKDSNVLTYYHESTPPSQGPTFTKIEYNKPPKVITHKIYIRNSESIIPDFTLIKYLGKMDDYYYPYQQNGDDPYNGYEYVDLGLPSGLSYEYVDLGLPSGLKWADRNVGADKPEDYGLYFQWGDTKGYTADQVGSGEGQKYFDWANYKFNPSGDGLTMTKYNSTDGKIILDIEDDAARINMGGKWRMPTINEIQELFNDNYTITTWVTSNGVYGRLITSKINGNAIFIPAAGFAADEAVGAENHTGYYWSSSLYNVENAALYLYFFSSVIHFDVNNKRRFGFPVRAVQQ